MRSQAPHTLLTIFSGPINLLRETDFTVSQKAQLLGIDHVSQWWFSQLVLAFLVGRVRIQLLKH
jgi:hypothetical protein